MNGDDAAGDGADSRDDDGHDGDGSTQEDKGWHRC